MKTCFRFLILLLSLCSIYSAAFSQSKKGSFYEIKVYHIQNKEQESTVDDFLKNAYLPALNREGIKAVGVFKPLGNDTMADKRIYVLVPFKSLKQFSGLPAKLSEDKAFAQTGRDYIEAGFKKPPYERLESILLKAFSEMPAIQVPLLNNEPAKRVYELRSYQSPTEQWFKNKVHMFNEGGEVALFKRLGFNVAFYGSVIAGSKMPNLMYMATFEDMASRDQHWKAFGNDPEWKRLSSMPLYPGGNVSKIDVTFLRPTDYSQI
jgi:hypothetical protein